MIKKLLKISALCILGIAFLTFFVLIIEPNETFESTGTLVSTQNSPVIGMCGSKKQFYSIKVAVIYRDRKSAANYYSFNACNLSGHNPFKQRLVSCQINVSYNIGQWFGDRSWLGPAVGIHDCVYEILN